MGATERITTILIDTCSFRKANCDFIGVSSKLLPSFFSVVCDKQLLLLTHPILEKEIEKHIENAGLCQDYKKLISQINKCKDVLGYAGYYEDILFNKISTYNIKEETFKAYKKYYKEAFSLDYPEPKVIFDLYFSSKPPFSSNGKKKSEFPDAFVIESAKQYIEEHSNDILLVVSEDNDWTNSFKNIDNTILCNTIDEAIKIINNMKCILNTEMQDKIFRSVYEEILFEAQRCAECEAYELEDYEFTDYLEIDSIEAVEIENVFVPLKITREEILIKTVAKLKISGFGEIIDEENSIWDSEDREYMLLAHADMSFSDGYAEVECEIQIGFDFDSLEDSAQMLNFKFINRGNICIKCDTVAIAPIDEDELAMRCLREDKGYPRKLN